MGSRQTLAIGAAAAMLVAGARMAHADGYPPFYGYSPYFGQTATYFTPDDTIHETTTESSTEFGLGKRTYYRGGPFWRYQTNLRRPYVRHATRSRRVVLRSRY